MARAFFQSGDLVRAEDFARSAVSLAPEEVLPQIEAFLLQITGDSGGEN